MAGTCPARIDLAADAADAADAATATAITQDDQEVLFASRRAARPLEHRFLRESLALESLGYAVREYADDPADCALWRQWALGRMIEALATLHALIPGLSLAVKRAETLLILNSHYPHPTSVCGYLQPGGRGRRPVIIIDGCGHEGHTVLHEVGHLLDVLVARATTGQSETRRHASETPHHPLRTLVSALKRTPEHRHYLRDQGQDPDERRYLDHHHEVFARAIDAHVYRAYRTRGPCSPYPMADPDPWCYEDYTPETLHSFGQGLQDILRSCGLASAPTYPPSHTGRYRVE